MSDQTTADRLRALVETMTAAAGASDCIIGDVVRGWVGELTALVAEAERPTGPSKADCDACPDCGPISMCGPHSRASEAAERPTLPPGERDETLVARLLSHLYRVYDAGGLSSGRSWESRLLEPALRLMEPYRPQGDINTWPDCEDTIREAEQRIRSRVRALYEDPPPPPEARCTDCANTPMPCLLSHSGRLISPPEAVTRAKLEMLDKVEARLLALEVGGFDSVALWRLVEDSLASLRAHLKGAPDDSQS